MGHYSRLPPLWAHRSYNTSKPPQYFLAVAGAGAVEGSIKWWSHGHHARGAPPIHGHRSRPVQCPSRSAVWSHIGWMIVKPWCKPGVADVSDLSKNEVVRWQHRWYVWLILLTGFGLPTVIPGLLWGDWRGGYVYAGAARPLFIHHSTFCVNSLAHWPGDSPFDNKHTPRDHAITAVVTLGEGYHDFHHQFPSDYRNTIRWYQYAPQNASSLFIVGWVLPRI